MANIKVDKLETTSPNFEMLTSDDITLAANYSAGVSGAQMFMDGSAGHIISNVAGNFDVNSQNDIDLQANYVADTSGARLFLNGSASTTTNYSANFLAECWNDIILTANYSAGVSGCRLFFDGSSNNATFNAVNNSFVASNDTYIDANYSVGVSGCRIFMDGSLGNTTISNGGSDRWIFYSGGTFAPTTNATQAIGGSALAMSAVYTRNVFSDTGQSLALSADNNILIEANYSAGVSGCRIFMDGSAGDMYFYSTDDIVFEAVPGAGSSLGTYINLLNNYVASTSGSLFSLTPNGTINVATYATTNSVPFLIEDGNSGLNRYVVRTLSARTASSVYGFFEGFSANGADREFALRGDGNGYADVSWIGGGADYAEYFESTDSTAIPVGTTVVLVNDKVRAYDSNTDTPADIMGVVRPKTGGSCLIGNLPLKWHQKYLRDEYGAYILDVNGERQLNPSYDEQLEYISREGRDEWNLIGLLGQVAITKGQTVHPDWKLMNSAGSVADIYFVK